ncbi:hypothetical protein BKP35_04455 [Anaerobacillus arseniciselenatis]|uniref:DUF2508 domain-containing protein n=1 Tax=Anaerobacillus arseniciselenatis TaxID=85682 RepID=A0A1S2LUM3_9BACI|nr:YaaL family protein [Anaerobacillus arseniciselenatis]OIJ16231.1 hypothetical protein BKP35_04455 [Anaerobacillus arseniciselenatis]
MLFRKKGKIRKAEDDRLIAHIDELKAKLMNQKQLVQNSVDPPEDVIYNMKLTEAKYLFLLKEARNRKTSMGKSY